MAPASADDEGAGADADASSGAAAPPGDSAADDAAATTTIPSLRYLDEFLTLRCGPDLLRLGLFPSAKEITESLATVHAARRYLSMGTGNVRVSDDDDEDRRRPGRRRRQRQRRRGEEEEEEEKERRASDTVLVVGDGATPRTAALFSYVTKGWKCVSVDPMLSRSVVRRKNGTTTTTDDDDRYDGAPDSDAFGHPWEEIENLVVVPRRVEDTVVRARKLVVILMHAHVSLEAVSEAVCFEECVGVVACPCCNFGPVQAEWGGGGRTPDFVYGDWSLLSDRREVRVWTSPPSTTTSASATAGRREEDGAASRSDSDSAAEAAVAIAAARAEASDVERRLSVALSSRRRRRRRNDERGAATTTEDAPSGASRPRDAATTATTPAAAREGAAADDAPATATTTTTVGELKRRRKALSVVVRQRREGLRMALVRESLLLRDRRSAPTTTTTDDDGDIEPPPPMPLLRTVRAFVEEFSEGGRAVAHDGPLEDMGVRRRAADDGDGGDVDDARSAAVVRVKARVTSVRPMRPTVTFLALSDDDIDVAGTNGEERPIRPAPAARTTTCQALINAKTLEYPPPSSIPFSATTDSIKADDVVVVEGEARRTKRGRLTLVCRRVFFASIPRASLAHVPPTIVD